MALSYESRAHKIANFQSRALLLTAAAEEERSTRKKHDYSFPVNAIDFCLKTGGIRGEDLDMVVFFEKPFLKFDRILRSAM